MSGTKQHIISTQKKSIVLKVRHLTESTFVIRVERKNIHFRPGQYISFGKKNSIDKREYSIYSGIHDNFLEILVKEVSEGLVSKELKKLKAGDEVEIDGPFGFFTIDENLLSDKKFLFIASGTGISPFHSFVKSYPSLDYTLIHGIRYAKESYEKETYSKSKYIACTSRVNDGEYFGRVTHFLKENPVQPDTLCYLCGNCDMIHDAFDILESQGVPTENLFAEVYF